MNTKSKLNIKYTLWLYFYQYKIIPQTCFLPNVLLFYLFRKILIYNEANEKDLIVNIIFRLFVYSNNTYFIWSFINFKKKKKNFNILLINQLYLSNFVHFFLNRHIYRWNKQKRYWNYGDLFSGEKYLWWYF